jgi:cell wall-associated NlpC family hydrolase
MKWMLLNSLLFVLLSSCDMPWGDHYILPIQIKVVTASDTSSQNQTEVSKNYLDTLISEAINTRRTKADELVDFAETLQGIPYKYGSNNPKTGFDCSGFVSYVFNHFGISVPRSSIGFTHLEKEIKLKEAKRGDIILFTGTDSTKRVVGHMGIITSDEGQKHIFIHSTSGKAYSVTKTNLNRYYQGRFVKVIRIFKDKDSY